MAARVVLAFANDNEKSLKYLNDENAKVYDFLLRMDNHIADVVQYKGVSIAELFNEFAAKKETIQIFHFSGHAGGMQLLFNEGKTTSGEAIAKLMGHAKSIELVFLNGCATADLVDSFHKSGVNTVIASKRKVFDEEAAIFSIAFYTSLSQFSTIGEAFDFASARLKAEKDNGEVDKSSSRHILTQALNESDDDNFPFSIFYRPIKDAAGAVKNDLQEYEQYDKWKFEFEEIIENQYDPCIKLVECIGKKGYQLAEFLSLKKPNAKAEIKEFGELDNLYKEFIAGAHTISKATPLANKIMDLLPRPLNEIMRRMVSNAKGINGGKSSLFKDLLDDQLEFYDVLLKFSCYIMLSDLFEVIYNIKKTPDRQLLLDKATCDQIKNLLSITKNGIDDFNYRGLIRKIRKTILDNKQDPFISEYMSDSFDISFENLEMAHEIIKVKKNQHSKGRIDNGFSIHCKSVENELCEIFEEVYFILRYNLLVVRNVEAIKTRFEKNQTFKHRVLLLREDQNKIKAEWNIINEYTENYSVILVKGLDSIMDYLSLSPFVIDKCILTNDEQSELFYYSHSEKNVLIYKGVTDKRDQIPIELNYKEEMNFATGKNENVITIPFLEKLREDKKVNLGRFDKEKAKTQLVNVYGQFDILKKTIEDLSTKI